MMNERSARVTGERSRPRPLPQSRAAPLPPMIKPADKRADDFYLSSAWRGLMARIKAERGSWCARCGAGGKGVRIIGDHIVEVKDGGDRLNPANVMLLCLPCHNGKTADARARRAGLR